MALPAQSSSPLFLSMITSTSNPRAKVIRSLYSPDGRRRESAYVIEGVRLMEEALAAGVAFRTIYYCSRLLAATARGARLLSELTARGLPIEEMSERVLAAVADTVTPQGVLAVLPLPPRPGFPADARLLLLLDGLQDPGNLGTMLRTALAAGADGVIAGPGCADVFAPKVVRAAMGAHFGLPVIVARSWDEISPQLGGQQVLVAVPQGGRDYDQVDWLLPSVLVVGGESQGVSDRARALATGEVSIPMAPGVESLNAAVAAGVMLFEARRQRLRGSGS